MESKKVSLLNKLSFTCLLATFFLSIFFFIPYIPVTLEASKGFLISVGIALSIFFWLVARLVDGKFMIPKDRLILFAFFIPIVFLISSFFSSSPYVSLFGGGFELGTFGSMLVLFIVLFLSSVYFQNEKRLRYFFGSLFLGALILGVFQILYLFFDFNAFMPGLFKGISSGNLVGSWNDFALFFGLIIIISLFTLEFLKTKKLFKILLYLLITIGLFFLVVINIPLIWLLIGLFSLVVFVYGISLQHVRNEESHPGAQHHEKKLPAMALAVMLVSLLFLIGGNSFGSFVSRYVSVYNPDIRPSTTATFQVAYKALRHNPFFGTGPNTFSIDWAQWKPGAITATPYWNSDFTTGVGLIPTFIATTGIVGLLTWLLFIIVFLLRGMQSLRLAFQNNTSNYFLMASFIVGLYGWIVMIVYTPNILLSMLTFAGTGVFLGVLVHKQVLRVKNFSFLNDPRNSFFAILALVVLMISSVGMTYVYAEKFTSVIYFSKGISATDSSLASLVKSEVMLRNAIALDKSDIYYRSLSQVYVAQIGSIINDKKISEDTLKSTVQTLVNNIEQSASSAVAQNPNQYLNWVNLGNVYASLVPLGVDKSYENAIAAYDKAQMLTPSNPSLLLARAQLEFAHKSNDEAKKFIAKSLEMKPNYIEAIFTLASIAQSEGNLPEAIKQAEYASSITPNDPSVFFQLGILRYNNQSYSAALSAFETAVTLDPTYLNARFFLGQSYKKVGRTDDARIQFELLNKVLPDNKDVQDALGSLSGASNTTDTSTNTPKLPLPEKN